MPEAIKTYVRIVDAINQKVGLVAMYMIFLMMAILLYSAITKLPFFDPSLWTFEMAQFVMVAYYLLGGGYSLQDDSHVRMDLLYGRWSPRKKAAVDAFTVMFMLFYVCMLLVGGFSSASYAWDTTEVAHSVWAPRMWPIKFIMIIGLLLMLLQVLATFFRNLAEAMGKDIS